MKLKQTVLALALAVMGLAVAVPAAQADPEYQAVNMRWTSEAPDSNPIITDHKLNSIDMMDSLVTAGDFELLDECDVDLYGSCNAFDGTAPIIAARSGGSFPANDGGVYVMDLPPAPPHATPVGVIVKGAAGSGESEEDDGPLAILAISNSTGTIAMDSTRGTDGSLETSALYTQNPEKVAIALIGEDPQNLDENHWVGLKSVTIVYEKTTPTGTIHVPVEWINEDYEGIPIEAEDTGFGLNRVLLLGQKRNPSNPWDLYGEIDVLCPHATFNNCPTELDPSYKLEIDPLQIKEGYSSVGIGVENAMNDGFISDPEAMLKVDTTKPTMDLSGTFMTAPGMVLDGPEYQIVIDAADGDETVANSGVKSIQVLIDDVEINYDEQGCAEDNCEMQNYPSIWSDNYTNGEHLLTVNVTDQVGHVKTRNVEFEVDR